MTIMQKATSPRTKWIVAAVVAVVVATFVVGPSLWNGGSALAFADVIEQLRVFRPYSCKLTVERHGERICSKEVMRDSLTRRREVMEDGSIRVCDLGLDPIRMLTLYPARKEAVERVYTDSEPTQDPDLLAIVSGIRGGEAEDLGYREIEGRKALGFHRPGEDSDFTIWVDPGTGLPLEIDLLHVKRDQRIIMTAFDFETPLEAELFSTTAPTGYTVRRAESMLSPKPTEAGAFRPHSCRQTVERDGKIVSESRIMRLDPSHRREVAKDGSIAVHDLSGEYMKSMQLAPEDKKAVITTHMDRKGPMRDPDLVAMSVSMRDGSEEDIGEREIEGRNAGGFRVAYPGNEMTFWLDQETKLPLRIEILHTGSKQRIVMDMFDFDVDFHASLFRLEAPDGYTVEAEGQTQP